MSKIHINYEANHVKLIFGGNCTIVLPLLGICDLLILHGPDATEWRQYLVSLFDTNHHNPLAVDSYELREDCPIPKKNQKTFQTCRCILILLSGDLENTFDNPDVVESLEKVLQPANKVIVLFCGVIYKEDFTLFFQDWPKWKSLSSEDDPDLYVSAVLNSISEAIVTINISHFGGYRRKQCFTLASSSSDPGTPLHRSHHLRLELLQSAIFLLGVAEDVDSGCGSVSDTDAESDKEQLPSPPITEKLLTVQPDRIRCGVKTQIYLIFKCKLDSRIKNEVHFTPLNGRSTCLPATLQNEYMLSVDAPELVRKPGESKQRCESSQETLTSGTG
ncbi:unnamed protein product [Ranitomeya imitator]|uniref:DBB domain-containing protein n=1 Tax=Ranitomeya imitator TaxID=111125 RepID=A0ABN9LHR2_9NEOB|nr:unnamed protein product [Ranitomeya imitator]